MQANTNKSGTAKESNLFSQVWFKYSPYWPLFLILLLITLGGAWAYIRYKTKPLYAATAAILVKDERKGQDESKMIEALNQLSTTKIIENEIEVLKSRHLMTQVVRNLHLYAPVYQKGKIKSISAYTSSPVRIQAMYPDSLNYSGNVFFTVDEARTKVNINGTSYPVNEWVKTPWGTLRFIPQNLQSMPADPLYFVIAQPQYFAGFMVGALDVSPVSKLSTVINLKILDENPRRAEDILNELIVAYNNAAMDDKNTLAANTLQWVDDRLKNVAKNLDSIERKIQDYKASKGAIDISSQGTLYLENVSALSQRLGDVNVQIDVLDQVEKYVQSKDKSGGIVPSTVGVSDPLLTDLVNKLYNAELEYEKLRKTTAENNPMALQMKEQIDKLKPSILENVRNQRAGLNASRSNISSLNNRYSSMLSSIPKKERDLVDISREQSIMSGVYSFLLTKKEETELALRASIADSRIVDKAQASFGPVAPDTKKIYILAVILAFAIGVGLVSAGELFKRTILYRHEIENYTSVPVIGEIAYQKTDDPLVIGEGKRTFVAEQFRNLRASLPYIGINGDRKKLLVTSTISGEGKSFIVANLGMSLAMTGKKVVVLEFDLSNPALSEKLGMAPEKGLAEYLNGDARKDEIVIQTGVHENLFLAPAGKLPENPSELITSEKVPELLNYLSVYYNYIIIDTAPVGLLSDAYILSGYCDASLYVVRHRHTPKISIKRIDENNKINELKNMAIVFNGVRSRGFLKNSYGYGYGYGYGYVYNNYNKKGKKKKPFKAKVA